MPRKPTPDEVETERLFLDAMRRLMQIPPDEAREICKRTAPSKNKRERERGK